MRRFSASRKKTLRLLMLKMMQDIGNKLEAKMYNILQILSKEIQNVKLSKQRCKIK